ncbi:MAG: hypothetical protein J6U28_07110 [Bacteroidales bacterium]|nr:hypothetical protein [Bacteroidales bacterium]MBP5741396.1 hypothetical protein [Bacteroidales bacterium]
MKRFLERVFLLFSVLISTCASMGAQGVSLSFSLVEHPEDEADSLAPYLKIQYHNESDQNYYFPAVVSSDAFIPRFSTFISRYHASYELDTTIRSALFEKKLFRGDTYILTLDYQQTKSQQAWFFISDTEEESEIPIINHYLFVYYNSLTGTGDGEGFYSNGAEQYKEDLHNSPALIYLKAGESFSQLICLRALKDAGINFSVSLASPVPPDTVRTGSRADDTRKLPPTVDNFKLYTDIIKSNSIKIDFSPMP